MFYLSQMLSKPVVDLNGEEIGRISDLAIQTGEVFPRITSLAFLGPSKTPFMVSWRKYVDRYEDGKIYLNKASFDIRFSYLQPDEILLARDLLNKQIVDTQGLKVVRVNDLKFSSSGKQLRLLGAEVGIRGILRGLTPVLEHVVLALAKALRRPLAEDIIAWNYMELVDRNLSDVKLSVTHKRLSELHPADVADILEQLDPQQRSLVFDHLDKQQAAETFSELEDEYQTDMIDDLSEYQAARLLAKMDPDDAADIIGELPYEKAEKLLWLMGVQDQKRIRTLLGYKEKTAGGIMTPEFVAMRENATVGQAIEKLRHLDEGHETVHYVYTLDNDARLTGALSLRSLVLADNDTVLRELATKDLITVSPDDDQEDVADAISKYDLLAMPVCDENGVLLGIVTVDDALEVLEEEHTEDLQIAGATSPGRDAQSSRLSSMLLWLARKHIWFLLWAVIAILCTMAGYLPQVYPALIFAPFVLLVAQETVTYALNDLLEYTSSADGLKARHLLSRNIVAAILASVIACGLALLMFFALGSETAAGLASVATGGIGVDGAGAASTAVTSSVTTATTATATTTGVYQPLQIMLLKGFVPAVASALLTIVLGTIITLAARKRLDKNRSLSSVAITLMLMLVAFAAQVALQLLVVDQMIVSVASLV